MFCPAQFIPNNPAHDGYTILAYRRIPFSLQDEFTFVDVLGKNHLPGHPRRKATDDNRNFGTVTCRTPYPYRNLGTPPGRQPDSVAIDVNN